MPRISSPSTTARVRALVALTSLAAMPLAAQDRLAVVDSATVTAPTEHLAPSAQPVGPTRDGAVVAARATRVDYAPSSADARGALAPMRTHHGPAVALMVVGAAAVVLGLLVGGDPETPLVVGGAVVGLIGLYLYLL
jgi:hypothetical protein